MDTKTLRGCLYQLACLYNVQTAYYDVSHNRQQASIESLLVIIKALGAPVASLDDVPSALRERKQVLRQRILEPVTVVWNGKRPIIKACVPGSVAEAAWNGHLEMEDNTRKTWRRPAHP